MTRKDQCELMNLMREQQRRESAECAAKAESAMLSATTLQKLTDNEWADRLISQAKDVASAPKVAWERWQKAKMQVVRLRAKAEGVGGMRLSHDKVLGGQPLMMADVVPEIWAAEEEAKCSWLMYTASVMSLMYCLSRAVMTGQFTEYQKQVWLLYYTEGGRSLQQVADLMHTSKDRIRYLVTSVRAQTTWCQVVEYIIENETNYEEVA